MVGNWIDAEIDYRVGRIAADHRAVSGPHHLPRRWREQRAARRAAR